MALDIRATSHVVLLPVPELRKHARPLVFGSEALFMFRLEGGECHNMEQCSRLSEQPACCLWAQNHVTCLIILALDARAILHDLLVSVPELSNCALSVFFWVGGPLHSLTAVAIGF